MCGKGERLSLCLPCSDLRSRVFFYAKLPQSASLTDLRHSACLFPARRVASKTPSKREPLTKRKSFRLCQRPHPRGGCRRRRLGEFYLHIICFSAALPYSLLCRNISRRDCPAPPQGRPAFPAVALPPALPSGQSGAVRRARRALSGTAWLSPLHWRWKQPRRSGHSKAPRRQPAGRRCPCSMHRGCRCSIG